MKKIVKLIYILTLVTIVSCTNDISSLNVDPKAYTKVPGDGLFTNATKTLMDNITTPSVNTGIFRLLAQHWTETTYTDESRYDLGTRNIPQGFWQGMYRDVLRDYKAANDLITADAGIPTALQRANELAINDIMMVYTYSILVNTFGDIPYTDALNGNNLYPKYDDAAGIYADLFTRLDADIAALTAGLAAPGFGGGADLIYNGSRSKWIRFANSLKVRMGMTLADVNPAAAKAAVESGFAGGVILTNANNAIMNYLSAPPNTNPVWVNLVQSGRQDFVGANTIVDMMNTLNDPRLPLYFTFDQTGSAYSGGIYGISNNYGKYSKPAVALTATTFPGVLIDAAEMNFYLAEAAERGFNVGGTSAKQYYNTAITLSITNWGGAASDATTYLANPNVDYDLATSTHMKQLATQKYLALYNRGIEGWTEYRRLDYPVLNVVANPIAPFPNRFSYPVSEQNLNTANFAAAAAKIEGGQDVVTAKIFWDKN